MNLRQFYLVILASAIPVSVSAGGKEITLNKGDFVSAERITKSGEAIVSVKLSKSGKAKLKKLERSQEKQVHTEIGGVESTFQLREPISGDGAEIGPYSDTEAKKVVTAINEKWTLHFLVS